jgi:hypothetical protein
MVMPASIDAFGHTTRSPSKNPMFAVAVSATSSR